MQTAKDDMRLDTELCLALLGCGVVPTWDGDPQPIRPDAFPVEYEATVAAHGGFDPWLTAWHGKRVWVA